MRNNLLLVGVVLAGALALSGDPEEVQHVFVKHVEVPVRYPQMAWLARVEGIVDVKLTMSPDGAVADATASVMNARRYHGILTKATEEAVKSWTFGCFDCPRNTGFGHSMIFEYRLEGDRRENQNLRVTMDLPGRIVIVANPPAVNIESQQLSSR